MAQKRDLYIDQGTLFQESFVIRDGNDQVVNLAGTTISGKIKDKAGGTLKASFTVVTVDAAGRVTYSIPAATSSAWTSLEASDGPERKITIWAYDLEWDRGGGDIVRLQEGLVYVSPEVTA